MKKQKILMYLTSAILGSLLGYLAYYCGVPWYIKYPCFTIMGIVIAIAWAQPIKDGKHE